MLLTSVTSPTNKESVGRSISLPRAQTNPRLTTYKSHSLFDKTAVRSYNKYFDFFPLIKSSEAVNTDLSIRL